MKEIYIYFIFVYFRNGSRIISLVCVDIFSVYNFLRSLDCIHYRCVCRCTLRIIQSLMFNCL